VNVTVKKCASAWSLRGLASAPVQAVRIRHCAFEGTSKANVAEHVEGLSVEDVTVNGKTV